MTTTEIETLPHDQLPDATPDPMGSMMLMAAQGKLDAAQMHELLALQREWAKDRAAEAFSAALAEFQRIAPAILKRRTANFGEGKASYKYAALDDIMTAIAPHLAAVGICVTFDVEQVDKDGVSAITVVTNLRKGIHVQPTRFTCPIPAEMRVNATQKMGAALSYAKRYGLMAALNLTVTGEDTDGAGLGETTETIPEAEAVVLMEMAEQAGADLPKLFGYASTAQKRTVTSFGEMTPAVAAKVKDMLKRKLTTK